MENAYTKHGGTKVTPQSQPVVGKNQVRNDAGGYVFKLDKWGMLDRFLVLGSEGGTYYVGETKLTERNVKNVAECIKEDAKRVVDIVVDISFKGRAVKNEPALFVLAMVAGTGATADERTYALASLSSVARTFTHLANFLTYVQQFRGWGRGLREAVSDWYNTMNSHDLAYQMAKYRQRNGWTHGDVVKLAHPTPVDFDHNFLFSYAVEKADVDKYSKSNKNNLNIIVGYEKAKIATAVSEIVALINDYGLTREMIPTQFMKEKAVWEALFAEGKMPTHALVRNLGNMSASGFLVEENFKVMDAVREAFTNQERIQKSRLHPLSILIAMKQYGKGTSGYGHNSWRVAHPVMDALNEAFYLSFDNVEPTGKRLLLACDVSGSMESRISGNIDISAAEATGALALVQASTEKNVIIRGFSTGSGGYGSGYGMRQGDMDGFKELKISPRQRLDDVLRNMRKMNFGGTDCALPMMWALKNHVEVDAFIVYTDNETWAGTIHPMQALKKYRDKFNPSAKLIVVGMSSSGFTIADPEDSGSLDIVGMDTSVPAVIFDFITG